jgi:hypothetical protein
MKPLSAEVAKKTTGTLSKPYLQREYDTEPTEVL